MRSFFLRRGYPLAIVNRALHKASSVDRKTALIPKPRIAVNDRIPFTLIFHPINNSIKPIINRSFNLLHSDLTTADILAFVFFQTSSQFTIFFSQRYSSFRGQSGHISALLP